MRDNKPEAHGDSLDPGTLSSAASEQHRTTADLSAEACQSNPLVTEGAAGIQRVGDAALGIHGMDAEQRAVLGFLARYGNVKTRGSYELDLRQFHTWMRQAGVLTMLSCDRTHLQLYVRDMEKRGLAPATIHRRIGTLRGFFKYAVIDDLIVKDPTLDLAVPKVDHDAQYRTWLTTLEFAALVKESRKDPRNHAMVNALGLLGLRVAEMVSLNVEDIHRDIGIYITFLGKGSKHAQIRLPFEVMQAFDTYIGDRKSGPLFLVRGTDRRWQVADVRRALTVLARHAGIEHPITPHGLRRTLARLLQERGVELGAIQQTMRHKDPRTTVQSYIGDGGGVADIARQTAASVIAGMAS